MQPFSDKPYRFFEPRYKPRIASLLRAFGRRVVLPVDRRIARVDTAGGELVREARGNGTRILFLPNHPTHADGQILMEAARKIGTTTCFMAAYDVFSKSRIRAWTLQALGCFSVDRECCDRLALRQAQTVLVEGRLPLTVFPEGHVYLQNDRVTPFSEGALFIGLAAARQLAEQGERLLAVPVAIKATFIVDVRPRLRRRIRRLANAVEAEIDPSRPPREALRAIGLRALTLNLRRRGISLAEDGTLPDRLHHALELVLESLGKHLGTPHGADMSAMERIRHARRTAHEVLLDPARDAEHAAARRWSDEAMLAWRIASYSGDYVREHPSIDRIGETVEKLEEDAFSHFGRPIGPRRAEVRFGTPLDLTEVVAGGGKPKSLVAELTSRIETSVQEGLDAINEPNHDLGSRLWDGPLGEVSRTR